MACVGRAGCALLQPFDTEMRYLYHLTEGNRGPVTFEQLQELAKAGTIDNMTPVLAEGAREWSRWLFIKNTPPPATPAPAPQAAPAPAPKTTPAPQKKEVARPAAAPAPEQKPEKKQLSAEAPKPEQKPAASAARPASAATPSPAPAPTTKPQAPAAQQTAEAAVPAPAQPASKRAFFSNLKLLHLIPAGVCAVITLLSLVAAVIWSIMAHDTREEYAKLRDMQAEHRQNRTDLDSLAAQQQQVIAENAKLQEDIAGLQHKLQLTKEESERLAKGPYISEAEAKQLKDEQAKAARLKEQEQKH